MADDNPGSARVGGEAIAVQGQVEALPALGVEPRLDVEAAGERHAGEMRPARQVGYLRAQGAAGQEPREIDAKIAIGHAVRRLDLQMPDRQLGSVVEIGVERQGAVEAAAAKFAGNRNPRPGEIGNQRTEPHPVE